MTDCSQSKEEELSAKRRAGAAIGFGTSFAAGMAVFAFLGHALDKKTGRESLFTLIGIGLGFLYGAWELWKLISASSRQADSDSTKPDKNGDNHHDTRQP